MDFLRSSCKIVCRVHIIWLPIDNLHLKIGHVVLIALHCLVDMSNSHDCHPSLNLPTQVHTFLLHTDGCITCQAQKCDKMLLSWWACLKHTAWSATNNVLWCDRHRSHIRWPKNVIHQLYLYYLTNSYCNNLRHHSFECTSYKTAITTTVKWKNKNTALSKRCVY
jgi:membrane-bound metal-dependent hydrolase YbcI (DUF457 family)